LEGVPQTGVIAQDVRRVLPDAVATADIQLHGGGGGGGGGGSGGGGMLVVDKDRLFLGKLRFWSWIK